MGEINNKYLQTKQLQFIKRTSCILPHIVKGTPISGAPTFFTDANKLRKVGYKSEDISKVVESPYNSIKKSELYAIFMVLLDF